MTKLEAFTKYMSQFAAHRGSDMQLLMDQSSHGKIFDYAWEEATKVEREACAKVCEDEAEKWERDGEGVEVMSRLSAAAIRARGEK